MPNNHVPKVPTDEQLEWIRTRLRILTDQGLVLSITKGRPVGSATQGHWYVRCLDRPINRAHLIWWATYGEWPTTEIYHRNTDSLDDRIENLTRPETLTAYDLNRKIPLEMSNAPYKRVILPAPKGRPRRVTPR